MMNEHEIAQALRQLDAPALGRLRDLVDVLLSEGEAGPSQEDLGDLEDLGDPGGEADRRRGARGWVELKVINGCGPYAYQRWWEGRVKRSKYIGKVRGEFRGQ